MAANLIWFSYCHSPSEGIP